MHMYYRDCFCNFQQNLSMKRMYLLTISGVLLTFGSKMIGYPGAGPLAIMTAAFVAAIFWKKTDSFSVSDTHPQINE